MSTESPQKLETDALENIGKRCLEDDEVINEEMFGDSVHQRIGIHVGEGGKGGGSCVNA